MATGTIPQFIRKENDTLYYSGDGEFVFIIPQSFFDKKCSAIEGEYVDTIGILNYTILKGGEKDLTKNLKTFNFPSRFMTKPGRIEKLKNFKLTDNSKSTDYVLLHYTDNNSDQIVVSTKVPQDIANVEDFFRLFVNTGNIPKTIPYDKLHEYFLESIKANGSDYKISAHLFGLIVSEICRDPENPSKPFRLSKAINADMMAYNPISIKNIPGTNSPYVSITSENWDESVIDAVLSKTVTNSPLEKVMMG